MLIDWFTVGAQVVNFLVLLALLKWLLFDRVVDAMDQREAEIAGRLDEASQKQQEADRRAEELDEARRELESKRQAKLDEAEEEAENHRRELRRKARDDIEQQRRQWQHDLQTQQDRFLAEMNREAGQALQRAVGQALAELADADLEEAIVRRFLHKLQTLNDQEHSRIESAMHDSQGSVVVASAEDLSDDQRRQLADTLREHFNIDEKPQFETMPELVCGVELRSNSQAVGWNLRRYLADFNETLSGMIAQRVESGQNSQVQRGSAEEREPQHRDSQEQHRRQEQQE